MTYALDSNTLIYLFKNLGGVARQLLSIAPSDVAIPSVVLYELEMGIALSNSPDRRRRQLDTLLEQIRVLPFDRNAAASAALIGAELKKSGKMFGPMDTLIAGTVVASGATLVTRNRREFQRVSGLKTVDCF
ncbi:MAG: type II toxin-antitoxin system VapC family toxin [Acidobacteriota bacterium]